MAFSQKWDLIIGFSGFSLAFLIAVDIWIIQIFIFSLISQSELARIIRLSEKDREITALIRRIISNIVSISFFPFPTYDMSMDISLSPYSLHGHDHLRFLQNAHVSDHLYDHIWGLYEHHLCSYEQYDKCSKTWAKHCDHVMSNCLCS